MLLRVLQLPHSYRVRFHSCQILFVASCDRRSSVTSISCDTGNRWIVAPGFDPGGCGPFWQDNSHNRLLSSLSDHRDNMLDKNHGGFGGAQGSSCFTSTEQGYAIRALCQEGQVDKALEVFLCADQQGTSFLSLEVYKSVLKACARRKALTDARIVHAHLARLGLETHRHLGDHLVCALVKCGGLEDAMQLFRNLPHRTAFSWSALISGCTSAGRAQDGIAMYRSMLKEGLKPNKDTFVSLLRAASSLCDLVEGKRIHAEAVKYGYEADLVVGTCIVDMYGKCGSIVDARNVFHGLSKRDVVSWTAMLAACVQQGEGEQALQLYELMREEGVSPNDWTFSTMLQVCGAVAEKEHPVTLGGQSMKAISLAKSKAFHADVFRKGYQSDVFLGSALIAVYGKCRSILDAQLAFGTLPKHNVAFWNAMLTTFVQQGQADEALQLYVQMEEAHVTPDLRTFVSVLQACGSLADSVAHSSQVAECLEKGKAVHSNILRRGCVPDAFVGSALISMYGKCGSIADAEQVFEGLPERNVVCWNGMLVALLEHGFVHRALRLFEQMLEDGMMPSEVTLMCALRACSHTGSLSLCRQIHNIVCAMFQRKDVGLHLANTLIYAYGKCGSMADAQTLFNSLEHPTVVSWTALIAGYAWDGNCEASIQCYKAMLLACIKPNAVTFLSVLSACNHAGLVDEGVQYLESMTKDFSIPPGLEHYSSIMGLLTRAGCFSMAQNLLSTMPMKPDLAMWLCVLGACRDHGNVLLGREAFDQAVQQQSNNPAAYMLMWNIHANAGLWNSANEVQEMRYRASAAKKPGQSWVEHEQQVQLFMVGDQSQDDVRLHDLLSKVNFPGLVTDMACDTLSI